MCVKARFDILYGLGFYKEHTHTHTHTDMYLHEVLGNVLKNTGDIPQVELVCSPHLLQALNGGGKVLVKSFDELGPGFKDGLEVVDSNLLEGDDLCLNKNESRVFSQFLQRLLLIQDLDSWKFMTTALTSISAIISLTMGSQVETKAPETLATMGGISVLMVSKRAASHSSLVLINM